jgi:hypothetical protein
MLILNGACNINFKLIYSPEAIPGRFGRRTLVSLSPTLGRVLRACKRNCGAFCAGSRTLFPGFRIPHSTESITSTQAQSLSRERNGNQPLAVSHPPPELKTPAAEESATSTETQQLSITPTFDFAQGRLSTTHSMTSKLVGELADQVPSGCAGGHS